MRAVLVSGNPGKLRELRALLPTWTIEPLDTTGIGEEGGSSFYENARGKAAFGRDRAPPEAWVIGEDSGLEVDVLGGEPGIRSARYAGPDATDEENIERLLERLGEVPDEERGARYVCELVALAPDGCEHRARGVLEGRVSTRRRGSAGFGYDPVFVPQGRSWTVAELGDEWKRLHSHRASAARALERAVGRNEVW